MGGSPFCSRNGLGNLTASALLITELLVFNMPFLLFLEFGDIITHSLIQRLYFSVTLGLDFILYLYFGVGSLFMFGEAGVGGFSLLFNFFFCTSFLP